MIDYFLTVAKTGNMSQAAQIHHISPPAISKAMKILQDHVGKTLLRSTGKGIRLTDEGNTFLFSISPHFEGLKKALKSKSTEENLVNALSIGSFEVFTTYFMENAIPKFFSDRTVKLHELIPGEIETAVAERHVDLGLTYLPVPHPDIEFLKISQVTMGIYGKKGCFKNIEERKTPFAVPIAPVEGTPTKVRGLDGWPEDAFPRLRKYEVTLLETALGLCRRGQALIYIPKFIGNLHNALVKPEFQLQEREFPRIKGGFPKSYVFLVKRKLTTESIDSKRLAAAVRSICS